MHRLFCDQVDCFRVRRDPIGNATRSNCSQEHVGRPKLEILVKPSPHYLPRINKRALLTTRTSNIGLTRKLLTGYKNHRSSAFSRPGKPARLLAEEAKRTNRNDDGGAAARIMMGNPL